MSKSVVWVGIMLSAVVALLLGTLLWDGSQPMRAAGSPEPTSSAVSPAAPTSSTEQATPAPRPSEKDAASPAADEAAAPSSAALDAKAARAAAEEAIRGYVRTTQEALAGGRATIQAVAEHSTGAALEESQAQAAEFADLGMRLEGLSEVVSISLEDEQLGNGTPQLTLSACLDDSSVTVFAPEEPEGYSENRRVLHRYVVTLEGGTWKVSQHTFPEVASC